MRHVVRTMLVWAVYCGVQAEEEFRPLLNGQDLSGWHSVRENQADGAGRFRVDAGQNAIHVYAGEEAGSTQDIDCLYTDREYSHYVLKLEYKWLERRYAPRVDHDRDAGLLFHLHGDLQAIWPNCVEMQLGESDATKTKQRYTTGDLWVIGKDVQVMNERGEDTFYAPGTAPVAVGRNKAYDSSFISSGNERPHGEWNEITLTVRGADEAIFELNGKVVNRVTDLSHVVDGKRVPLDKGRIGLQAEYAELMYRNLRIQELPPPSAPVQTRVWKPGADSAFEVGTQIRAWTIHDEGMETILDNMQSIYPIPKSLIASRPEWQQRKIDGSSWSRSRFCPNHPEVREYVVALFGDLAANYDLDYIQTCQHLFYRNNTIEDDGTCFCRHCIAEADTIGFDLQTAIPILKANPDSQPEKDNWLNLRRHTTTEFYRLISEEIQRVRQNPSCHLRYNDTYPYRGWILEDVGMHLDEVAPYLGSLVNQDHEEQKGNPTETFGRRKAWLEKNRGLIGPDMPLICGIAPRIKATPELVKQGIRVALEHPAKVDGLAFKHYDGASFGLMRAFKQGMIEAGVQGLPPLIGNEVEDMDLDNFNRIDDYVEEWGVETAGEGTASFRFNEADGPYDIRITYFDEEAGQSQVQLMVDGKEVINFRLDEDVDCWRWRRFENIPVNRGDEIRLVAQADSPVRVRLDFVEFMPVER